MKTLLLALGFCLLTSFAFADVTSDPVAIDLDDKGNIRVWVQYSTDGVEEVSQYPKIDGKSVYCSRFSKQSFLGMTKEEVEARIEKDHKAHRQTLIQKAFNEKTVKTINQMRIDYNRQANQDFMDSAIFPDIIGKKVTEKEATVALDTDGDGVNDKEILIKTDGSQSISPVSP